MESSLPSGGLPLVDAHAHLCAEPFAHDLVAVLARARARGVLAVLAVTETLVDAEETLALARRHPLIRPCAGLHPTVVDRQEAAEMVAFIRAHADELVAVGEVGLDRWVIQDEAQRAVQREILARQIALARELDLPLNVHSRSAGRHTIAFLREQGARRVLLHAFDGKASAALPALEAGYFFSIPPSIVRSPQKQKLARQVPLERLLLESDAPVLGPSREERNEPANILLACEAIAAIKGVPAEDVACITTQNARRLFPGALPP